jgi:hypothetical protein
VIEITGQHRLPGVLTREFPRLQTPNRRRRREKKGEGRRKKNGREDGKKKGKKERRNEGRDGGREEGRKERKNKFNTSTSSYLWRYNIYKTVANTYKGVCNNIHRCLAFFSHADINTHKEYKTSASSKLPAVSIFLATTASIYFLHPL